MSAQERDKLLLSDTLVPDLFITQYMSSLSGAAIQLYLLLLMDRSNSSSLTIDSLARKIGWTKEEVKEQVFHLTSAGLMERDGEKISLSDIKAKEVDRYIEWKENAGLITPPQHVDPSMESLSSATAMRAANLIPSARSTDLGMSSPDSRLTAFSNERP